LQEVTHLLLFKSYASSHLETEEHVFCPVLNQFQHVSGYIPMRCVSKQEPANIMMVPVISVDCSQFKMDHSSFPLSLHANFFYVVSICWLASWLIISIHNYYLSN